MITRAQNSQTTASDLLSVLANKKHRERTHREESRKNSVRWEDLCNTDVLLTLEAPLQQQHRTPMISCRLPLTVSSQKNGSCHFVEHLRVSKNRKKKVPVVEGFWDFLHFYRNFLFFDTPKFKFNFRKIQSIKQFFKYKFCVC